jgi:hypothetical protein
VRFDRDRVGFGLPHLALRGAHVHVEVEDLLVLVGAVAERRGRLVGALDVDRVLLAPRERVLARAVHARHGHECHRRGVVSASQRVLAQLLGERGGRGHQIFSSSVVAREPSRPGVAGSSRTLKATPPTVIASPRRSPGTRLPGTGSSGRSRRIAGEHDLRRRRVAHLRALLHAGARQPDRGRPQRGLEEARLVEALEELFGGQHGKKTAAPLPGAAVSLKGSFTLRACPGPERPGGCRS